MKLKTQKKKKRKRNTKPRLVRRKLNVAKS